MKPVRLLALLPLTLLCLNVVAKEDKQTASPDSAQKTPATNDLIEIEEEVAALEAALEEKQLSFDKRAAELQEARNELMKESAGLQEAKLRQRLKIEEIELNTVLAMDEAKLQTALEAAEVAQKLDLLAAKRMDEELTSTYGHAPYVYELSKWVDGSETSASLRRGYIGVSLGTATDSGIPIQEVYKSGPAQIAGVQTGDVIKSVAGIEVSELEDATDTILALVASYKPGSVMQFKLQRDRDELDVEIATIAHNPSRSLSGVYVGDHRFISQSDSVIGVLLGDATDTGVPIQEVYEGGPADIAGIQADDEILAVADIKLSKIDNPTAFTAAFISLKKPGSILHLEIANGRKVEDLSVAVIDRQSLTAITTANTGWAYAIESVRNPESKSIASSKGFPIYSLHTPRTDTIFVMEIEEEFGDYFNVDYGVLVLKAEDVEGIQAGDILLEIDEKPVRSLSQAFRHKQDADSEVKILFKRNKREKNITLDTDSFSLHAILE